MKEIRTKNYVINISGDDETRMISIFHKFDNEHGIENKLYMQVVSKDFLDILLKAFEDNK